jgi:hypothetical protein
MIGGIAVLTEIEGDQAALVYASVLKLDAKLVFHGS